eukprot:1455342-Prymnesium_polylepis.1
MGPKGAPRANQLALTTHGRFRWVQVALKPQRRRRGLAHGQAAAPAAALAPTVEQATAMAQTGQEAQPAVAEPRVAAAAEPHKRRA